MMGLVEYSSSFGKEPSNQTSYGETNRTTSICHRIIQKNLQLAIYCAKVNTKIHLKTSDNRVSSLISLDIRTDSLRFLGALNAVVSLCYVRFTETWKTAHSTPLQFVLTIPLDFVYVLQEQLNNIAVFLLKKMNFLSAIKVLTLLRFRQKEKI